MYLSVYGLFSYLLTFLINKSRLKGEKSISGDGNCFYRAVAFRRDETGAEKHEEIRRWSGSLFQEKVFELRLFAIFKYKNSHGFFNTNIFDSGFFG